MVSGVLSEEQHDSALIINDDDSDEAINVNYSDFLNKSDFSDDDSHQEY